MLQFFALVTKYINASTTTLYYMLGPWGTTLQTMSWRRCGRRRVQTSFFNGLLSTFNCIIYSIVYLVLGRYRQERDNWVCRVHHHDGQVSHPITHNYHYMITDPTVLLFEDRLKLVYTSPKPIFNRLVLRKIYIQYLSIIVSV